MTVRSADVSKHSPGEAPYFGAPYPDNIIQVHEPETRGEREVVEIIKNNWPAEIGELEEKCDYSGSFIRQVLRNHFARATETDVEEESDVEFVEEDVDEEMEEWKDAFRTGMRVALTTDLNEGEAADALASGFHEGRRIKEELAVREFEE